LKRPHLLGDDGTRLECTIPDLITTEIIPHDGADVTFSRKEDGAYLTWTDD
jgi:hypothetical protein